MHTLHSLLSNLKEEFASSRKGEEREAWFVCTLLAIILPFTSSKTSGLVRALESVFGFAGTSQKLVLHIYGFRQDSLGVSLGKALEVDPPACHQWQVDYGA